MPELLNVARRLVSMAERFPDTVAIAESFPKRRGEKRRYKTVTFARLNAESDEIARALAHSGVMPGMRLVLMVRQGIDFITLFYGILKAGAVVVLIDPGMGMRRMIDCLADAEPDGFIAIPAVHAVRCFFRKRFLKARFHLTAGPRWFWGGLSLQAIRKQPYGGPFLIPTGPDAPAAIIFTSGSTGTPKGVLYTHRVFDTQVHEVAERFGIEPGGIDLAGFPFFGLFNAAMGTTAVIPEMDPTRPAKVDPEMFLEIADDWHITQSFGSPALWNRVCSYCERHGRKFATLKRCILAGAPISPVLLERVTKILADGGEAYTPYGATEALPVAAIGAADVLGETAARTREGEGICVGKRFGGIAWKIIRIVDEPIASLDQIHELPPGEIGELIVSGPQVTRRYVTGEDDANARAKIPETTPITETPITEGDGERDSNQTGVWHRMGDVGYLDEQDRFWFCGRKGHRVETTEGPLYSIPCEAIFNRHPKVYRSALAGASQEGTLFCIPWVFIEPYPGDFPKNGKERLRLIDELRELARASPLTSGIEHLTLLRRFPVDVRHNAKINREKLSDDATALLNDVPCPAKNEP
ncbi:MAG TPA: peptide synthase [Planctomycetaceae bacterium]|nr:peptide synthase [Planctomycetaceae bacterium]